MEKEVTLFHKDAELPTALLKENLKFVRVEWTDNANLIRCKAVPIDVVLEDWLQFNTYGVGIVQCSIAQPVWTGMYPHSIHSLTLYKDFNPSGSGLSTTGEFRLIPQWDTVQILPWAPSHARVMGNFVHTKTLEPWSACPRAFLKRMINELAKEGLTAKCGFENEVFFFKQENDKLIPVDNTTYASSFAMDMSAQLIDDVYSALREQVVEGIPLSLVHAESGCGQIELVLKYTDALVLADRQIAFRETVHAIAAKHGLKVSLIPKMFDGVGSGLHLHMSLWKGNENITSDTKTQKLSETTEHFLAGVLEHLPALMAITTPSCNSYRRILPGCWAGAYRCWGLENREAALRLIDHPSAQLGPQHFELKTMDGTANPYLSIAAILAAGVDGIRKRLKLPQEVKVDPATLTEEERKNKGVERLPTSLSAALDCLAKDEVLLNAMGKELSTSYLATKRAENSHFEKMTLEEEVKILAEKF